jgi:hypothetical protein
MPSSSTSDPERIWRWRYRPTARFCCLNWRRAGHMHVSLKSAACLRIRAISTERRRGDVNPFPACSSPHSPQAKTGYQLYAGDSRRRGVRSGAGVHALTGSRPMRVCIDGFARRSVSDFYIQLARGPECTAVPSSFSRSGARMESPHWEPKRTPPGCGIAECNQHPRPRI